MSQSKEWTTIVRELLNSGLQVLVEKTKSKECHSQKEWENATVKKERSEANPYLAPLAKFAS